MKQNRIIYIVVILAVGLFLVLRKRQGDMEKGIAAGLTSPSLPPAKQELNPASIPKLPATALKRARTSIAIQIRSLPGQVYLNEKLSPYVEIKGAEAKPLDVVLVIQSGPTNTFATGTNMQRTQRGVAAFTGLSLKLPGTYDIYAMAGDEKSPTVTVKVSAPPPRQVPIIIDGKELRARFEYPDKYVLPDGEAYERVTFGQSIVVIEGVKYKIVRAPDDSLTVTTVKD